MSSLATGALAQLSALLPTPQRIHPAIYDLISLFNVLPELLPFSRSCDDCTFLLLFYPEPQGSVFLILCLIPVSSTVPGLTQKLFAECMQLARETLHKKSSEVLDNEEAGSIKVLSKHGALIKDRVVGDWRGLLQQCGGTLCRHRASLLM